MGATGNATGRTVYVGNLPATASVDELLNLVHFGPLESIRVLPEKSCVFLSFLDGQTASAFHADATVKKLSLHGQELKIGWGKPSPVPAQVALAISQSNASRNVYIGGLDENMTEEQLRDELSRFGLIDQVKIVRDKNIGFVHFLSISVATKVCFHHSPMPATNSMIYSQVVNTLPTEPAWAGKRINFGKDRCAYIPKSQQVAAQQAQAAAAQSLVAQTSMGQQNGFSPFMPYVGVPGFGADMMGNGMAGGVQGLNRTVYLGNIHPETTTEDLCNAIRGGVLQSIRYMQDKHIAVSVSPFSVCWDDIDSPFVVCDLHRPRCCLYLLPSGVVPGSHSQQPPPQGRLGQERGSSPSLPGLGRPLWCHQECLHWQHRGL